MVNMASIMWKHESGKKFRQDICPRKDYLSKMFYTSTYICPYCGNGTWLYKANVGDRVMVGTPEGLHTLKSTFLCNECHSLFSAVSGKRLSEGDYYVLTNREDVDLVVDAINEHGISEAELMFMSRFNLI